MSQDRMSRSQLRRRAIQAPTKASALLRTADARLTEALAALSAAADATPNLDIESRALAAHKTADAARETVRTARLAADLSHE